MLKRTLLSAAIALAALAATSQEVVWDVDFNSVFNNREGGNEQTPDQTFLFTRLEPEVGLSFKHNDQTHRLMGGVAWYQPMNDRGTGYKVLPTLYYQGSNGNGWSVAIGMFPRRLLAHQLPKFIWSDSLNYCTPNVRGILIAHDNPNHNKWAQVMLDWRQMQTLTQREAFNVAISGGIDFTPSFYGFTHIQYNHLAKRKNAPDDEGVNDDLTINPMLGWRHDFNAVKCSLEAGAIVQMQRCRALGGWDTPAGFIASLKAQWRWLDVEETFFKGKDLFPLYEMFGSELNLGDPYYRSKTYSRTDVRAHIFRNSCVDLNAMLSYHITDQCTGFWQQLSCRVFFNQQHWKNRHDSNTWKQEAIISTF